MQKKTCITCKKVFLTDANRATCSDTCLIISTPKSEAGIYARLGALERLARKGKDLSVVNIRRIRPSGQAERLWDASWDLWADCP